MTDELINRYIHLPLNEEVTAIGGHYAVTKELTLTEGGKDVFCTIGYGILDTTCCGTGGCAYATVHGFILNWQEQTNDEGFKVSFCQPIRNKEVQNSLRERLMEQEVIQQVVFI